MAANPLERFWRLRQNTETFRIMEDGEPYCIGIVFALSDVLASATPPNPLPTSRR